MPHAQKARAVIVMTRIPVPGLTKTRMMPALSAQQCANLHACLIEDTRNACRRTSAGLFVCYADEGDPTCLQRAFGSQASYLPQGGGPLGVRMRRAVNAVLQQGFNSCAVIGTDAPELSGQRIDEALNMLDDCDVVLGPSFDGGYYLIGMKRLHEQLFELDSYGHDRVLADTQRVAQQLGLSCGLLPTLHDMDTVDDLRALHIRAASNERVRALATTGFAHRALACCEHVGGRAVTLPMQRLALCRA